MEPFRIRDVIHTNGPRGNYYVSKPTTVKPSTTFKAIVVNPGETAPIRLRVFVSTKKPQTPSSNAQRSGTNKYKTQWWNQPTPTSAGRQKAIDKLRSQLSVVQAVKHDPRLTNNRPTKGVPPVNGHYERSFIPVVIKNNGSFDTVVARAPSHAHNFGNPAGHVLALTTSTHNGKSIVPVLVRAKEPVRRTIGDSTRSGIQTPLGRLPYPNTSARKKTTGSTSQNNGESYLPLLVPHKKRNETSTVKKNIAPLIPLVVPEKKDDNLYILHQMLSILNENPQSIAARGIKIVGTNNDKNIRTRVVRSADHNQDHNHDDNHSHKSHEHEDHDHDHEGHDMHHTNSEKTSSSSRLYMSTYLLSFILCLILWKESKQELI